MKIAMIGHKKVPSREGGIEIVVQELSSRMAKKGHKVVIYNRKHKPKTEFTEYKGCELKEVFTINKKIFDAIVYAFFAIKKIKKSDADIVHIHAEGSCAFLRSLRRKKNMKKVVTIHGLDWQRGKWSGFGGKFLKWCEKQAVKYADEIIVLSENNVKYFKQTYGRDTVYIPNGISEPILRSAELITEKWGIEKDGYVLFLARLVPEKGAHYLVNAWKELKKRFTTDKNLVIAGGNSHSDDYFREITKLCHGDDSIIMTGFVQGRVLEELYSNAYLYVLPSDIEGMPMSLLEALSYGNKCLVSDIPENTEVIKDKGYTFRKSDEADLSEKLETLIKAELITHTEKVIPFDWDEITEKTLDIYKR